MILPFRLFNQVDARFKGRSRLIVTGGNMFQVRVSGFAVPIYGGIGFYLEPLSVPAVAFLVLPPGLGGGI